ICSQVIEECLKETGKTISIDKSTLLRRYEGGQSLSEFNESKGWLTKEEAQAVLEYAIDRSKRGFGLGHRDIKEHVDDICRARYGAKFPETGTGVQWTNRFVEKYSEQL
ncbi:hypothetical protein BKA93DRAFT_712790, partial [Sparassis latifolia]